jgi:hypothetical protein
MRTFNLAAALVFSGAALIAAAQQPPTEKAIRFADEPIASPIATQGAVPDAVNAIVQALNAEASLKNAKITVQPDGDNILLTGRADNKDQVKRATEIARSSANNAMVVNVIQPDHMLYDMPSTSTG